MVSKPRLRDSRLIDALENIPQVPHEGTVWRVVREGRDPCQPSASGGRWDDGTFEVLYTALERDGAIAEMHFHLMRGQPIFPSRVRYTLHELRVELPTVLRLPTLAELATLGLDTSRYGQLSYLERTQEYPRTQEVAEVAHFLDSQGILVPNARWACTNLVIFLDRAKPDAIEVISDHGVIDWSSWERQKPTQSRG
jgi:RES domain-containing protein